MNYPHVMRLAGPWEFEVLRVDAGEASVGQSGRIQIPGDWGAWLGRDFRGAVRYRRHFHRPTNLDPHEQVWLAIEGVDAWGSVSLNGCPLGEVRGYALTAEFEITDALLLRNELTIDVECPPHERLGERLRPGREDQPGGLLGAVRLEIRVETA